MKTTSRLLFILLLGFSSSAYPVEITPLYGYRGGGEFYNETTSQQINVDSSDVYGMIIGFPYTRRQDFEIYYSHQSSQLSSVTTTAPAPQSTVNIPLTLDYLHFGGTAPISDSTSKIQTFVSGGLGFTYLNPDIDGSSSDIRFSLSVGFGAKLPVSERIALRLETRALATLFNNSSAILCNGGCQVSVSGNMFLQAEVLLGLAISF